MSTTVIAIDNIPSSVFRKGGVEGKMGRKGEEGYHNPIANHSNFSGRLLSHPLVYATSEP